MTNADLAKAIDELKEGQQQIQAEVSELKSALDELTGAKKALLWLTGMAVGVATVIVMWFKDNHKG